MNRKYTDKSQPIDFFNYIPREFALKALICWIFQSKNRVITANDIVNEPILRDVGMAFLKVLDPGVDSDEQLSIRVFQDLRQNDILILINERRAHVIDFDTGTGHFGSPLSRVQRVFIRNEPSRWLKSLAIPEDCTQMHYLTTGNLALCEEFELIDEGIKVTDRVALHQVLSQDKDGDTIVQKFKRHLYDMEQSTQSFRSWSKQAAKSQRSVEGFLRHIETRFLDRVPIPEWQLLVKPDGTWHGVRWTDDDAHQFEVWVEPHRISVKSWIVHVAEVSLPKDEASTLEKWSRSLTTNSFGAFKAPRNRRPTPKPICIAEWLDWIHYDTNDVVNLTETLRNLNLAYEAFCRFTWHTKQT